MTLVEFIKYARKFLVAVVAALGVLAVGLEGGMTANEWIQAGIAFAGSLGVYTAANTPAKK